MVSLSVKVEGKVKDTVMVNGTRQSVDLVALICYNKLKKKCPGETLIFMACIVNALLVLSLLCILYILHIVSLQGIII